MNEPCNLVLIGFMGAGKTTVGQALAARLGWATVDCDALIEARAGKTIAAIFAGEGEAYFRDMETAVAADLDRYVHTIITTGGGVVERPENLAHLRRAGQVIYLRARPETLYERVAGSDHRPLLQVADPRARVRELLARRTPAYEQADRVIDTDDLTIPEVVERILGS
ncbi:MAG: shikimate kinase [Nitrospirota bacterium]|jgi:shikimate kinase